MLAHLKSMGSPICFKEIVVHLKPFGIVDVGVRQFLTLLDENGWIIFRNKVQELVIFLLVQYR